MPVPVWSAAYLFFSPCSLFDPLYAGPWSDDAYGDHRYRMALSLRSRRSWGRRLYDIEKSYHSEVLTE